MLYPTKPLIKCESRIKLFSDMQSSKNLSSINCFLRMLLENELHENEGINLKREGIQEIGELHKEG